MAKALKPTKPLCQMTGPADSEDAFAATEGDFDDGGEGKGWTKTETFMPLKH